MRTRISKISLFAVMILTAAFRINAQINDPNTYDPDKKPEMAPADKRADMPASKPVEVTNLMKFLGNWEADAAITMEGKTYNGRYTWEAKETADGNGLLGTEGFSNPEIGTMTGTDLAGFDPNTSKIKWFTVDNMGTAHEHSGEWVTPDHLFIEHQGIRDGKKYDEKIDFTFRSPDEIEFKLTGTLDGNEIESGKGVFHKK